MKVTVIKQLCNEPGCRELIPFNKRYCPKHEREHQARAAKMKRSSNWSYKFRMTKYGDSGQLGRFYHSKRWTKQSRLWRIGHPLCAECLRNGRIVRAQVTDHVVPLRTVEGWKRRWDSTNYQSLCISCHNKKTEEDKIKYHLPTVKQEYE